MSAAALPWRVSGFAAVRRLPPNDPGGGPAASPAIDSLRGRDPDAWRDLFEAEMPAIFRYARARLGDPGRAEDATSDVFEQAWRSAHRLEDHGLPVRAWLFGIARNVVNSQRRSWFRRPPELTLDGFETADAHATLSAERLDLARAIASLEHAHGEVITLRFVHGLSLQETADVLDASVDAIKGRQARALAALKARLEA